MPIKSLDLTWPPHCKKSRYTSAYKKRHIYFSCTIKVSLRLNHTSCSSSVYIHCDHSWLVFHFLFSASYLYTKGLCLSELLTCLFIFHDCQVVIRSRCLTNNHLSAWWWIQVCSNSSLSHLWSWNMSLGVAIIAWFTLHHVVTCGRYVNLSMRVSERKAFIYKAPCIMEIYNITSCLGLERPALCTTQRFIEFPQ